MNPALFLARRIAFNKQKSFSRFIIRLSVAATVISVAVMIVTLSFVNGFQEAVSEKIFSFWGHVRIGFRQPLKTPLAEEEPIRASDSLRRYVAGLPGVRTLHPYATKNAILKTEEEIEGVLLKGLDTSFQTEQLKPFLTKGRWISFSDSSASNEVVISEYTARQLKLDTGQRVLIYFVQPDQSLRVRRLTITGLYKTGIEEYDRTIALGDLALIRRLNDWEDDLIGGYEVFLDDFSRMDEVSSRIFASPLFPATWQTSTAREVQPNIFDWLTVIDTNSAVLIIIMIIIAVINLITCLIILVLERLQMIGTLKALGASDWTVQRVFLFQSAYITLTGVVLGVAFSLLLMWLQQETGFVRLDETAYYMDTARVKVEPGEVAAVAGGTLLVSLLVLLLPSIIVRRVQPIRAIRFR